MRAPQGSHFGLQGVVFTCAHARAEGVPRYACWPGVMPPPATTATTTIPPYNPKKGWQKHAQCAQCMCFSLGLSGHPPPPLGPPLGQPDADEGAVADDVL